MKFRSKSTSESGNGHQTKRNRHSYIELLEEVTQELNLEAVRVDPSDCQDEIVDISESEHVIQDAFHFLDNEETQTLYVLENIF